MADVRQYTREEIPLMVAKWLELEISESWDQPDIINMLRSGEWLDRLEFQGEGSWK